MKKSGVIFDARKLRPPGRGTLLSLIVMSLLLFFTYQHFYTPTSHTAHAQYYPQGTPNNPPSNTTPGFSSPTYNNPPTNSVPPQTINQPLPGRMQVTIQNMQFMPAQMTIPEGTVVIWSNQDTIAHTTTSDNGIWDSGALQPGQSFSRMFTTPGTYTYHCSIHPFMHGTIIVTRRVGPPTPVPINPTAMPTPPPISQPMMYNPPMYYSAPGMHSAMQSQSQSQSINSSGSTSVNMQQSQSESQSINY